jgi:hypothetical protein
MRPTRAAPTVTAPAHLGPPKSPQTHTFLFEEHVPPCLIGPALDALALHPTPAPCPTLQHPCPHPAQQTYPLPAGPRHGRRLDPGRPGGGGGGGAARQRAPGGGGERLPGAGGAGAAAEGGGARPPPGRWLGSSGARRRARRSSQNSMRAPNPAIPRPPRPRRARAGQAQDAAADGRRGRARRRRALVLRTAVPDGCDHRRRDLLLFRRRRPRQLRALPPPRAQQGLQGLDHDRVC